MSERTYYIALISGERRKDDVNELSIAELIDVSDHLEAADITVWREEEFWKDAALQIRMLAQSIPVDF